MASRLWKLLAAAALAALLAGCNLPNRNGIPTPTASPPGGALTPIAGIPTPTATRPGEELTPPAGIPTPTPSPAPPLPTPTATLQQDMRLAVFPVRHQIDSPDQSYSIDLRYPSIPALGEDHIFNSEISSLIEQIETLFIQNAAAATPAELEISPSGLRGDYELTAATQGLASVKLNMSEYYSGAAHPLPYTISLTYLLVDGRALALDELFQPGSPYLERIAEYSRAQLEPTGMVISPEGFEPVPENYRNWNVSDEGLVITFDVYQVAPYAAGPQVVIIPWAEFSDMQAGGNPLANLLAMDPLEMAGGE